MKMDVLIAGVEYMQYRYHTDQVDGYSNMEDA